MKSSHFHVMVRSGRIADYATFSNEMLSVVQGLLDALGFHLAAPLRAELTSLVVDGSTLVLRKEGWDALSDASDRPLHVSGAALQPFIQAVTLNPCVRHALADVRAALEYPDDTAFYSYRAIESIRQWFIPGEEVDAGPARKQSWDDLRATLVVDRTSLDDLSKLATPRRHGETTVITEAQRIESLRLARKVLERFVAHLAPSSCRGSG